MPAANLYAPAPELYYAACGRIDAVRGALDYWTSRESPGKTDARNLIEVLRRGCDRLRSLADNHLADWKAGHKDRFHIEQSLAFLTASAAKLNSYLSIFEARSVDGGMPQIALPLKLLLQRIAPSSQQHSFIFFATHDFNFYYSDFYRTLRKPLLLMSAADEQAFRTGLPEHIALVGYSSMERNNILTLIILLHELSHYVDQTLGIGRNAPPLNVDPKELDVWLAEAKRIKYTPQPLVQQFGGAGKVPATVLEFYLKLMLIQDLQAASVWVRELTADILAARMLGLGFFLTQKKFLGFFPGDDQQEYPPHYRRFWAIAGELLDPVHGVERKVRGKKPIPGSSKHSRSLRRVFSALRSHFADLRRPHISRTTRATPSSTNERKVEYLRLLARDVIERTIGVAMAQVTGDIRTLLPRANEARLNERVFEVADLLANRIAPSQNLKRATSLPPAQYAVQEVLNGTWLAWIEELKSGEDPEGWAKRLQSISRLALRGIELSHFLANSTANYSTKDRNRWLSDFAELKTIARKPVREGREQGVLSRDQLVKRMLSRRGLEQLYVGPINEPQQIGESSIDVSLGNEFFVVARTRTPSFKIGSSGMTIPPSYYESHKLGLDESLLLHPGEFILGSTLEYLALPADVMAYVIGRSTLGRLGLIIATATHVAPGYKGTITLELTNVGTVPIELTPGIRIAQLVFHGLVAPVSRTYASHGRYAYSVGPEVPKV